MFGNWSPTFMGLSIRAWTLTLLLSELGLIFLLLPNSTMGKIYWGEREMVASQLGEETLKSIEERSAEWFKWAIVDTGALKQGYDLCEREGKDRFDDRGFASFFAGRLDVFWMSIRQMFFRFGMIRLWLPCAVAFFPMLIVDALLQRRIRQNQSSASNTLVHHYSGISIALAIMGILLAPLLPLPMRPLSVPIGIGVCGAAVWFWLANYQKRS